MGEFSMILILIPVITSFLVCWITLYFTGKRSKEALKQQIKIHEESMVLAEKKYQEQLNINAENERLKYMPYLSIFPQFEKNRFEGYMEKLEDGTISIPFKLVNEGLGTAFYVHLDYLEEDKPVGIPNVTIAFQNKVDGGYNVLGAREPIDTDILRPEQESEFCLYLDAVDNTSKSIKPTKKISWSFNIKFCDIQKRYYLQTYTAYTSIETNAILRINSNLPQLIK